MSTLSLPGSRTGSLADGFAEQVARWATERGAPPETVTIVTGAARTLSIATAQGHVCIDLEALATCFPAFGSAAAIREALLQSGVVGTPAQPQAAPLILDDDGRVYLHRYFDYERQLAACIVRMARPIDEPVTDASSALLEALFPARPGDDPSPDWQRVAAWLALRRQLLVISGGPGTGKTTTVVRILALLLAEKPEMQIRLAAPTGKAGARMLEAIAQRSATLPEHVRDRLPSEAFTLHRLLQRVHRTAGRADPLPLDLLIVDEASMLDLALAAQVFAALPPQARVILLGDKDQLAAVESGAVFAELSADPALTAGTRAMLAEVCGAPAERLGAAAESRDNRLADSVVWLRDNFRFRSESGIGRLAADVLRGDSPAALRLLEVPDTSVQWLPDSAWELSEASFEVITAGLAPYLASVQRNPSGVEEAMEAFGRFRLLCALRDGPRGAVALNDRLSEHARAILRDVFEARGIGSLSPWFPGRPVMVTRNDYASGLMNGDIGIALFDGNAELRVFFPSGGGNYRNLPPGRVPQHETAFAMTIHKSQGSEFDHVFILLPDRPGRILSRELLYTAITRARTQVALCGGPGVVHAAIEAPTQRESGLLARLREAAADAMVLP